MGNFHLIFSESSSLAWNLRVKDRIETSVRITEPVYITNAGRGCGGGGVAEVTYSLQKWVRY